MSDEAARSYESRLLELFPAGPTGRAAGASDVDTTWLTGAWVTVPPERESRLSDEARAFPRGQTKIGSRGSPEPLEPA